MDLLSKLPSVNDIIALIDQIKERSDLFYEDEDGEDGGYIDITIATNGDPNDWGFQLGDNSYSGQCYFYHHWAVGIVSEDTDSNELALSLLDQLQECLAYESLANEC